MGKGEKLSKKEKGFVKDYAETGNATLSAKRNFDVSTDNSAGVIGNRQLSKVKIQKALLSIAEQIPDKDLVKVHREGLRASKEVWKNNESGEIELISEEPDYAVRHKYLDSAYKIKGTYAPEKMNLSGSISISSLFDKAQEDDNE